MSKAEIKDSNAKAREVRACMWSPPGCHPVGCGVKLTIDENGKMSHIEGDPDHYITNGRLCVRCLALDEIVYHEDRVLQPMVRDKADRGFDRWKPISWDEALDLVEEKVNYVKENWGPESIAVTQGTGREACLWSSPLAYACLGTPNFTFPMSGDSCYGPRCAVASFIIGGGYPELDYAQYWPDRYDNPQYEVPKYVILWGKDPLFSNPDGFFGHAVIDLMKLGTKLITVDPRVTWLSTRADYHLQLRPGTDSAVALGMINVIIEEGLYDHDFVENWCYGFEDMAERAREYTPERVAEITWVDKDALIGAARAFAQNKPSSILWGLAIDTQTNGVQAGSAVLSLGAICGYLDCPGGIILSEGISLMGKWRYETSRLVPPEVMAKRLIQPEYQGYMASHDVCHPDDLIAAMETDKPYPIKMFWMIANNMLANTTAAQPRRWLEALRKCEFVVSQDIFMTPTAMATADLFLPVSSSIEHVGIVQPHFGRNTHFFGAMKEAVKVGDTKSDIEICMWLGKRLQPEAWPWETVEDFYNEQIQSTGLTIEKLNEEVVHPLPFEYYKWKTGKLRPDGQPGFITPTGKIELYSTLYEAWDEDPLPFFEEPKYNPSSECASEYPLVLTTGSRRTSSFHSEHRQSASMREITPEGWVQIHPDTAAEHGIVEGDWVAIENQFGRCVERAKITPIIDPRVVNAAHGWWYPEQDAEEPNLFGLWKSSINSLIPLETFGKLGYGAPYKNVMCKIYKVDSLDS